MTKLTQKLNQSTSHLTKHVLYSNGGWIDESSGA